MEKVSAKIAIDSVNEWLDHKRVARNRRDAYQGMIDNMVESVMSGDLVLMEDMKFKHILVFPLKNKEGEETVTELIYKDRISDVDLTPYKKIVKGNDLDASLKKTILALTGVAMGIINNLDSSTDRQIAESIAVFFV